MIRSNLQTKRKHFLHYVYIVQSVSGLFNKHEINTSDMLGKNNERRRMNKQKKYQCYNSSKRNESSLLEDNSRHARHLTTLL